MHANKVSDFYDNLDKETKRKYIISIELPNQPWGKKDEYIALMKQYKNTKEKLVKVLMK